LRCDTHIFEKKKKYIYIYIHTYIDTVIDNSV